MVPHVDEGRIRLQHSARLLDRAGEIVEIGVGKGRKTGSERPVGERQVGSVPLDELDGREAVTGHPQLIFGRIDSAHRPAEPYGNGSEVATATAEVETLASSLSQQSPQHVDAVVVAAFVHEGGVGIRQPVVQGVTHSVDASLARPGCR